MAAGSSFVSPALRQGPDSAVQSQNYVGLEKDRTRAAVELGNAEGNAMSLMNKRMRALMLFALLAIPCSAELRAESSKSERVPRNPSDAGPELVLSKPVSIELAGARAPTLAVDRHAGTTYLAWAREIAGAVPAAPSRHGHKPDAMLQIVLARSEDGGRRFGAPVAVSLPGEHARAATVNPAQVAVGQKGEVYVLYSVADPNFTLPGSYLGRASLKLARSGDGGRSFAEPVTIGSEAVEGTVASLGMINLFAAPDGALYASWLDSRESIAYVLEHKKHPPHEIYSSQLRVARSTDGGRSFSKSALVTRPVCVCCGTKVAQGKDGPLYASTRGVSWPEVKGSVDAVRDIVVATSNDRGETWSEAIKIHDDGFKVSGCPDVTPGLAVDSKGRLHAAWYTGTERHPGIFHAVSSDQGKTFSQPVALLTDEWLPYADVKLALDENDNAWVAFEDRRGETDLIHLVRIAEDGGLSRAKPWPGTGPDLVAKGGSAIITWGTLPPEGDEEEGEGGINVAVARPGTGS